MGTFKIQKLHLPQYIRDIFERQNLKSCKDILSLTKLDLQAMLGYSEDKIDSLLSEISKKCLSNPQTVFDILHTKHQNSFLSTSLEAVDVLLQGGLSLGSISELVGPPGVGKTQFCFMLSIMASLTHCLGGLDSHVIYIDTESTFSAYRLKKMAQSKFPNYFSKEENMHMLLQNILVHNASSVSALQEIVESLESEVIRYKVKLIVIDSIASLMRKEYTSEDVGCLAERNKILLEQAAILKNIAQTYQVSVFLTNQISSHFDDVQTKIHKSNHRIELLPANQRGISPALGGTWYHCVTTRLIAQFFDTSIRQLIIAKSPVAPNGAVRFKLGESGPVLVDDDIELLNFSNCVEKNILTKYHFFSSDITNNSIF